MALGPRLLAAALAVLMAAGPAHAQLDKLLKGLGVGDAAGLPDAKVGAGLREALEVATDRAVASTGKVDGYLGNQAIKILMPEQLRIVETGLRTVGYGPQVDEFVVGMNRAAEQAAPAAKPIFLDAIKGMSFEDARKILSGGSTSATDYFKGKTTDQLTAAFKPIVEQSMSQVGVTRQYNDLIGRFKSIPFARVDAFNLDNYVVGKSLDGLFYVVGEQESLIRANPAARTTDLLREVFATK